MTTDENTQKPEKPKSLVFRLKQAAQAVRDKAEDLQFYIDDLEAILGEFDSWYEDLSEKAQEGANGQKIRDIADISIPGATDIVDTAEQCLNADFPKER